MKIWMDEGFSFGLSVFETIGIENGQPLFLGEHLERMEESANFSGSPSNFPRNRYWNGWPGRGEKKRLISGGTEP